MRKLTYKCFFILLLSSTIQLAADEANSVVAEESEIFVSEEPMVIIPDQISTLNPEEQQADPSNQVTLVHHTGNESNTFSHETYCCQVKPAECPIFYNPSLKFRIGAFLPSSERFTEIYGESMPVYQFEGTWTFRSCYKAWINVDWLSKKGDSHHLDYYTTIKISNISFGISIPHKITEQFSAYAGLGPSFAYVAVHNRFTTQHIREQKVAAGLVLKTGLIYEINCDFFADFFIDYLYQPSNFRTRVNLGGLKTGAGIGFRF